MYLDVFSDNSFETNCWLIAADGTDDAVVVDPGFSPERVHAMLESEGKRPVAVLATHGHFDHVGAATSSAATTCRSTSTRPTSRRSPTRGGGARAATCRPCP